MPCQLAPYFTERRQLGYDGLLCLGVLEFIKYRNDHFSVRFTRTVPTNAYVQSHCAVHLGGKDV